MRKQSPGLIITGTQRREREDISLLIGRRRGTGVSQSLTEDFITTNTTRLMLDRRGKWEEKIGRR